MRRMRIDLLPRAVIVAALCGAAAFAQSDPESSELAEGTAEIVAEARERLAAVGYPVPDVGAEPRTPREVIADLDAQQDLLMPADAFVVQHRLYTELGFRAGRTPKALRRQAVASMARGASAYYDPIRDAFVLLPTATRDVAEALAGSLAPLVTHELVHAHQDAREGGLEGFFRSAQDSLDAAMARRIVIEGEAELVAVLALAGEGGVEALDDPRALNMLDSLFAGELTGAIYDAGRRLARARHRAGGVDAVRALWSTPPATTEQALHPDKHGRDVPVAIDVPEIDGLTVGHGSPIGELLTFNVMRMMNVPKLQAAIAAAGWDGDHVVVFDRGEETAVAVLWRSVWDREEDARDFAERLGANGRGVTVHEGRVVDWVSGDDEDLRDGIVAACAADRPQPDGTEDAESTAAAEAALRERLRGGSVDGAIWRHDRIGVAVPIPDGWEVREVQGVDMLFGPESGGFAMNVNVQAQPRGAIADLAALLAISRRQLERAKLTVDSLTIESWGDTEVVAGEYHGRVGATPPLHFLALGFLGDETQIFVTVTATEAQWEEHADSLRALRAGVTLEPR